LDRRQVNNRYKYPLAIFADIKAAISCNTTAGQNILLGATPSFEGQDATNDDAFPLQNLQSAGPNVNTTVLNQYWFGAGLLLLQIFAPPGLTSMLLPSIVSNNISSLAIELFGKAHDSLVEDH